MAQLRTDSTVGGKQIATEDQIEEHVNDSNSHITELDKNIWNKKSEVKVHTHDPSGADIWLKVVEVVELKEPGDPDEEEGDGEDEND